MTTPASAVIVIAPAAQAVVTITNATQPRQSSVLYPAPPVTIRPA